MFLGVYKKSHTQEESLSGGMEGAEGTEDLLLPKPKV